VNRGCAEFLNVERRMIDATTFWLGARIASSNRIYGTQSIMLKCFRKYFQKVTLTEFSLLKYIYNIIFVRTESTQSIMLK
jgi:hypothetical protein